MNNTIFNEGSYFNDSILKVLSEYTLSNFAQDLLKRKDSPAGMSNTNDWINKFNDLSPNDQRIAIRYLDNYRTTPFGIELTNTLSKNSSKFRYALANYQIEKFKEQGLPIPDIYTKMAANNKPSTNNTVTQTTANDKPSTNNTVTQTTPKSEPGSTPKSEPGSTPEPEPEPESSSWTDIFDWNGFVKKSGEPITVLKRVLTFDKEATAGEYVSVAALAAAGAAGAWYLWKKWKKNKNITEQDKAMAQKIDNIVTNKYGNK